MLSLLQIKRMIHQRQFRQLIERILANGRSDDRKITQRLLEPRNVVGACLGLSLQRVVELTYRPTAAAEALACRLLDQQRGDGLFGAAPPRRGEVDCVEHSTTANEFGCESDELAVTAIAVRALAAFAHQMQLAADRVPHRITVALDRALDALTLRCALHHQLGCDSLDRAIVLWQFEHQPAIAAAIRLSECEAQHTDAATHTRAA